jgi:hypothetical protein
VAATPKQGDTTVASKNAKTLLVVTENGRIVAAAFSAESSSNEMNIALKLSGTQRIHKVEVPEELGDLSGHHLHLVFSQAQVDIATGALTLPKVTTKRLKH